MIDIRIDNRKHTINYVYFKQVIYSVVDVRFQYSFVEHRKRVTTWEIE